MVQASKRFTRRNFMVALTSAAIASPLLAACAPKIVEITKEVVKEVPKEVVKEVTKEVVKEKEVTKEVVKEVVVTPTPPKPTLRAVELNFTEPPTMPALEKAQEIMNQPQIKVKVFSHADYLNKLKVAFAAGSGPDLFRMNVPSGKFWMAKGIHMALTPWLEAYPDFAKNMEGFVPSTITSYTHHGELMGVPFSSETSLGYFNRNMFEEAGVETPDKIKDWNWNTQLETMLKMSKGEGRDRVYGMFCSWHTQGGSAEFIYGAGAKIISDDGLSAECGSKEMIEAVQWMVDLIHKHKVAPEPASFGKDTGLNLFSVMWNWKAAYVNSGEWAWWMYRDQQLKDKPFKLGFVEPPKHPVTGKKGAQGHTLCVAMYSKTRFRDEAAALLMPFSTKDVQSLIAPQWLPARIDAQGGFYQGEGGAEIKPIVEATQQYAAPYPASALEEAAVNTFWTHIDKMFQGQEPVEEGCKAAEKEINDALLKAAAGR